MKVAFALEELRNSLRTCRFPLPCADAERGRSCAKELTAQLEDYILPRYQTLDAPLIAVVGGSTGSGKSLLVNSLMRQNIALSTAIRPTTRRPLLVHAPQDQAWFDSARVLPGLARVSHGILGEGEDEGDGDAEGVGHRAGDRQGQGRREEERYADEQRWDQSDSKRVRDTQSDTPTSPHSELELYADPTIPTGLALLDSPDIDSVVVDNRRLAAQLLGAADLWVFVTTAARYADAIPWNLLHEAAQRNIVLAVVLNRVPPGTEGQIVPDLRQKLAAGGLGDAPVFVIPEHKDDRGFIPEGNVAPLQAWLAGLAKDAASRAEVARQTLRGATGALLAREQDVVGPLQSQVDALDDMRTQVDQAFLQAAHAVEEALKDGSLLRSEVVARWQEIVGTGEWMARLESGVSSLRDRVVSWFGGGPKSPAAMEEAIEDSLQVLLVSAAEDAVAQSQAAWLTDEASAGALLDVSAHLRSHEQRSEAAALAIRQWQRDLVELVSSTGRDKKTTARIMAVGVNVIGAALIIVIFASTAGLTGAEVAVAGGTAVAAQKVLEAVFGDDAVRRMADTARADLLERAAEFFNQDQEAFDVTLADLGVDEGAPEEVAARFAAARRAERKEGA